MKDFHSGTEGLICQKNCEGWLVGVWEVLDLGSIPNDHTPSQKDPKISIEMRCSTILPFCWWNFHYLCCQLINEKADARFIFFWYSSGKHIGRLRGAIIWWDYSYLYSYFVYIFLGVNFGLFLFTEYIGVCSMIGCE